MRPDELARITDRTLGLPDLDRREFFKLVGSGLTILFWVEPSDAFQEPAQLPARPQGYPSDFNAYLHIGEDGRVTALVGKVELGQGSMTALPQLLAEELDVALASVDIVMGDTDLCPWDMGTFGSLTIRQFGPVFRAAAAEARGVLLQMAAEALQAPVERLAVKDGVVADTADRTKRVTYAQLTKGQRIERHLEKKPPLKPASLFTVVGQSAPRRDAMEKVTGKAKYAADQALPGTLHARIVRPPAHGAKLVQADTVAAEAVEGARVVRDGDLIAVLHERPDLADKAFALIKARFDRPPAGLDDKTIFDHLVKNAPEGKVVHEAGSLAEGQKLAAATFDETYLNSYVAHATMETHSAVAKFEGDRCMVWASTQAPFTVKAQVAQALKVAPEKVHVIMPPYVGAGFGGKTGAPQAVEAARLAKIVGRPVQVVWDRAEEFFYDTFRPAAVVTIKSGMTSAGKIVFWDFTVYAAGDRNAEPFYDVPHQRTTAHGGWQGGSAGYHPFGVGPWRAPSVNTNTFARESHIDIMAAKAGTDPYEFRMRNLTDPRMQRVAKAVAAKFGWTPKPAPSGRGVGVAFAIYANTYVATMAEAAVDRASGHVQVKRVAIAQDEGVVVNPEGSRQQIEGSITMGLGYALTEEVRFTNGEIAQKNFDTYEIPHFSWLPKIDIVIIDNPGLAAEGCGEPPIVCMGAVVANAIHDAVGERLRQLPMTPERIKEALRKTT
jgi:isoquinoline 1-oxidoreductase